jgi:hypothetical protein
MLLYICRFLEEKTIAQNDYYRNFVDYLSSSSSVFLYINTNELSDAVQMSSTAGARRELRKNEDFYT